MHRTNFHQWRDFAKEAFKFTSLCVEIFCIGHVTTRYLFNVSSVSGPSMLPTFDLTGNFIVAEALSPRRGKIALDDVVLVRSPENPKKVVLKRLLGMEGDCVTFNVDPRNSDTSKSVVVPKGHVWVQGDNEYNSRDSRHFGAVPYALVQGRACWRIWPPTRFGPV